MKVKAQDNHDSTRTAKTVTKDSAVVHGKRNRKPNSRFFDSLA